ncbi:unnamed protein product [Closterium sp. Yama58-4]|nr:unnamed protein product [Closterium sp. Yama58-4]
MQKHRIVTRINIASATRNQPPRFQYFPQQLPPISPTSALLYASPRAIAFSTSARALSSALAPCTLRAAVPFVARDVATPHSTMSKVHGSLARAGKVRGQTPKVEKQDKKKQPKGRAHKRMQYNRRFVTAVVGFGKKRGPNSSEK